MHVGVCVHAHLINLFFAVQQTISRKAKEQRDIMDGVRSSVFLARKCIVFNDASYAVANCTIPDIRALKDRPYIPDR